MAENLLKERPTEVLVYCLVLVGATPPASSVCSYLSPPLVDDPMGTQLLRETLAFFDFIDYAVFWSDFFIITTLTLK